MTVPSGTELALLILGAYRLTRLGGWDAFPPIARLRARIAGQGWEPGDPEISLPGKTPEPIGDLYLRPTYQRPLLAHLLHCPFCLGWWISLTITAGWYLAPRWTLYALLPFAISGAAGLLAKNLD